MASTTKKRKVDADELDLDIEITSNMDLTLDDLEDDDITVEDLSVDVLDTDVSIQVSTPKKKTTTGTGTKTSVSADLTDFILDPYEELDFPTILGYGKSGSGKTTFGGTADGAFIIAADKGTMTLRNSKKSIKKMDGDEWDRVEAAYWMLANGKKTKDGIVIQTKSGPFTVKYVVLDTITKLIQVCLRSVVLGDKAGDVTKDVVNPTLRDWGTMTQKLSYWLMQFKELPIYNVWLVQETSSGEVGDDEFSIFPDVNRAMRNFIQQEADVIGRLCVIKHEGEMKYAMRFGANNQYVTKDRTGALNGTVLNPQLDKLIERIMKTA